MERTSLLMTVMIAVATLAPAVPAGATTITECQSAIAVLMTATDAATSLSPKDESGLLSKAQNASLKLNQGKFRDALQKLEDYESALAALYTAPKPKISQDDYATLNSDSETALTCVQNLIAGT